MNKHRNVYLLAASALLFGSVAGAQTPTTTDPASPNAASSPHQRNTTGSEAAESPADAGTKPSDASTRHQREATRSGGMEHAPAPGSTGGQVPTTFVQKAAQSGMTEVELGKLALSKTQSEEIRSFADRMVKDHSKANTELMGIVSRKQYQAPKELDAEHKSHVTSLSGKSGNAFDAAYAEHMRMAHGKAVALFTDATKSSDADLAAFAQKTLPTLEQHKKMADGLKPKMKTASAGADSKE
jgi:putative membrane protein